ncbi:MAG: hypothetical protein U9R75_09960, partial [Candidatus Thermoplasmatota archaeon]|nr:hypothetical protein [Candidatus Thermoplasmatota archaeon]
MRSNDEKKNGRMMSSGLFEMFTGGVGRVISSHPGKVIGAFLLLTLLMAIPLTGLDTSTKMSDFFPESEFLEAQETLRTEFNTTRRVIGVLEAGSGNILDRDGLLALKRIENQISSNNEVRPYLIDH